MPGLVVAVVMSLLLLALFHYIANHDELSTSDKAILLSFFGSVLGVAGLIVLIAMAGAIFQDPKQNGSGHSSWPDYEIEARHETLSSDFYFANPKLFFK